MRLRTFIESLSRDEIIKNPSLNGLIAMINADHEHVVKGVYDPATQDIYVAPAFHFTHGMIQYAIDPEDNMQPFIIAETMANPEQHGAEPQWNRRYGIALVLNDATYSMLKTTDPHAEIKQNPFFQLPQISRLNWADSSDRSWLRRWR